MKELLRIYKESNSPLEKANIWAHILEKVEEISIVENEDEYSDSLYYSEDDAIELQSKREAYKRGFIKAIEMLNLN